MDDNHRVSKIYAYMKSSERDNKRILYASFHVEVIHKKLIRI